MIKVFEAVHFSQLWFQRPTANFEFVDRITPERTELFYYLFIIAMICKLHSFLLYIILSTFSALHPTPPHPTPPQHMTYFTDDTPNSRQYNQWLTQALSFRPSTPPAWIHTVLLRGTSRRGRGLRGSLGWGWGPRGTSSSPPLWSCPHREGLQHMANINWNIITSNNNPCFCIFTWSDCFIDYPKLIPDTYKLLPVLLHVSHDSGHVTQQ